MELHRSYCDVELGGDFFVRFVADHRLQDLLLPGTERLWIRNSPPFFEEFFCPRGQAIGQSLFGGDQNGKISRFRPSDQALHRKQTRHPLNGAIEIRAGGRLEFCEPAGLLTEYKRVKVS